MPGPTLSGKPQPDSGLFGKLPGQGDFLTRRLPAAFLSVWDSWLQTSLHESREALGEAWLDAYLTSPIWQFVLTTGVAGQSSWAGLMMPSVDRVGRYFPLTVASALPRESNPFICLRSASDWFARTQALMLDALEGSLDVEGLDRRIAGTGPTTPASAAAGGGELPATCAPLGWRVALGSPAMLEDMMPALLHQACTEVFCSYSLWWSSGSERLAPSLLSCQGLPAERGFSALLTGDWTDAGWWDLGSSPD
jgi:type VI secretion system protein ImpM